MLNLVVQLTAYKSSYKLLNYNNLIEKERLANISNKKEIIRPDGKKVEAFEFTGKLVESGKKESMTIEELYKRVVNEN